MVVEDVFLRDEAHLEVELVELARQTVGARILVAEAGRDLEIAVEAGDHQELLVLLRSLRQGVELARHGCGYGTRKSRAPSGEEAVRIGVVYSAESRRRPCGGASSG